MSTTFRPEYKELSQFQKDSITGIKEQADILLSHMKLGVPLETGNIEQGSRELSLAITNLEQAVMWAVKHWTA